MTEPAFQLRLRVVFPGRAMIGPGKAELLRRIRDTGSISAAGRQMAMSYKRAWSLVEEMNAAFRLPLVESARGGPGGGGARLTETGVAVLAHYTALAAQAEAGGAPEIAALEALLAPGGAISSQK
ncbi:MAG: hypothetical protein A2X71_13150 [Thiobacillus sp. GWE1_62_9]|nr:MAG: hypothetical protein A2X71_13150 [Thiobacillus sp. GWE1_62_9]HBD90344.1 hypothetical protein [Gemmobacter sp.]HBU13590.1 hypothetical protein [Gemmobacter sp.]